MARDTPRVLEDGKIKVDRSTLAQDLSYQLIGLVLRMDGKNVANTLEKWIAKEKSA